MKVLIVDDHALFRDGLIYILQDLDDSVGILEANNTTDALDLALQHSDLDLILLDQYMPGIDGINALGFFKQKMPEIPIVIISSSEDQSDIQNAIQKGASGYIPKSSTSRDMMEALKSILDGNIYLPHHTSQRHTTTPSNLVTKLTDQLSPRQTDVLSLICQGLKNREIAEKLQMNEGTVKIHITAIFRRLNVKNRVQALLLAEKEGFRVISK